MQRMLAILRRDLTAIEGSLLALAREHRDTVMLGRTHGQPGLPITFGFKAAGWAAEIKRHLQRVDEAEPRLAVGQLAGAVGTLSAYGEHGPELQRRLLDRLGLGVPDISWLTARDRIAELTTLLALATGTLAKIGNEVYNLQRPEIGELSEAPTAGVVGSITMPQKRNPERSEHLVTLARVVRAAAGLALEGLVGEHERDGAAWKTEWAFLPEACSAAAVVARRRRGARRRPAGARRPHARERRRPGRLRARRAGDARARAARRQAPRARARAPAALAGQEAGVTLRRGAARDRARRSRSRGPRTRWARRARSSTRCWRGRRP